MRKDAGRDRQKLIVAVHEIIRTDSGDVPIELFTGRASLVRGALYGNFSHRQTMREAVLINDLDTGVSRAHPLQQLPAGHLV